MKKDVLMMSGMNGSGLCMFCKKMQDGLQLLWLIPEGMLAFISVSTLFDSYVEKFFGVGNQYVTAAELILQVGQVADLPQSDAESDSDFEIKSKIREETGSESDSEHIKVQSTSGANKNPRMFTLFMVIRTSATRELLEVQKGVMIEANMAHGTKDAGGFCL
ncbi:hypothetical protein C5167_040020 [Papaver somniferum]|uniref:Uncharacterized protein n=1 Tax=Papaver somniferum TaxID=3469 RepID=A0A4Y7IG76_PAPSO|nr:hypothetical protein C5167_040020 [Papaver somniferum]